MTGVPIGRGLFKYFPWGQVKSMPDYMSPEEVAAERRFLFLGRGWWVTSLHGNHWENRLMLLHIKYGWYGALKCYTEYRWPENVHELDVAWVLWLLGNSVRVRHGNISCHSKTKPLRKCKPNRISDPNNDPPNKDVMNQSRNHPFWSHTLFHCFATWFELTPLEFCPWQSWLLTGHHPGSGEAGGAHNGKAEKNRLSGCL